MNPQTPMTRQSASDIQKARTQEWLAIFRQLLTEISKHPGIDMAYRKPSDEVLATLPEAEVEDILVMEDRATRERKAYFEAMAPLKDLVMRGRIKRTDPRIWKLTFALGKGEFRPKYGAVEVLVADLFDIPETEADAKAQEVIDSRGALPPPPVERKDLPPWLGEFKAAIGDCEYAEAFLYPLLNMSDEAARRAIVAIGEGRLKAKAPRPDARADSRKERRDYVDKCLRAMKGH